MVRVKPIKPDEATGDVQNIFSAIKKEMGNIPNIFQNMANSSNVLKAYLCLEKQSDETSLDPKLRSEISLVASQTNNCQYCLSAHTTIAKGKGIDDNEIMSARNAVSKEPKNQAILQFAKNFIEKRGFVNKEEVNALKEKDVSDKELAEIFLVIMQTMFTNYFNHLTDPDIDFPKAPNLD